MKPTDTDIWSAILVVLFVICCMVALNLIETLM